MPYPKQALFRPVSGYVTQEVLTFTQPPRVWCYRVK